VEAEVGAVGWEAAGTGDQEWGCPGPGRGPPCCTEPGRGVRVSPAPPQPPLLLRAPPGDGCGLLETSGVEMGTPLSPCPGLGMDTVVLGAGFRPPSTPIPALCYGDPLSEPPEPLKVGMGKGGPLRTAGDTSSPGIRGPPGDRAKGQGTAGVS